MLKISRKLWVALLIIPCVSWADFSVSVNYANYQQGSSGESTLPPLYACIQQSSTWQSLVLNPGTTSFCKPLKDLGDSFTMSVANDFSLDGLFITRCMPRQTDYDNDVCALGTSVPEGCSVSFQPPGTEQYLWATPGSHVSANVTIIAKGNVKEGNNLINLNARAKSNQATSFTCKIDVPSFYLSVPKAGTLCSRGNGCIDDGIYNGETAGQLEGQRPAG